MFLKEPTKDTVQITGIEKKNMKGWPHAGIFKCISKLSKWN